MRIGFFCNEYPPRPHGGIGTFVRQIAEGLAAAGHAVTVVEFGKAAAERQQNNVRVVTLRESTTRHIAWLVNRLRLWRWLRKEVLSERVEVFEIPEYQGPLPFPFTYCPVVVRLHLSECLIQHLMQSCSVPKQVYWLERATLFWHRPWIAVSRYVLDETTEYFSINPTDPRVVYCPCPDIPLESLPPTPTRPIHYVLYAGTVSERKGALMLAGAMRQIMHENPDTHLVYVGPETSHYGRPISDAIRAALGEDHFDRTHFTGRVSHEQTLSWMQGADLLTLPSRVESFGLVVVEAMRLGIPVVYSNVGPGPELIENGVHGLLVTPYSEKDLNSAIKLVLSDKHSAFQMALRGKLMVEERFSLNSCMKSTLDYYNSLLFR